MSANNIRTPDVRNVQEGRRTEEEGRAMIENLWSNNFPEGGVWNFPVVERKVEHPAFCRCPGCAY